MSSSSSCYCEGDDFNPDTRLRTLVNLSVEHADGSIEPVIGDGIVFVDGANFEFMIPEETDETTINVSPGTGIEDPYYRDKYNALAQMVPEGSASGGGADPEHPSWTFTDASIWLAAMNHVGADPITGAMFLTGDDCVGFGEFLSGGYPEPTPAELRILDICIPCLDCLTYLRVEEYLDRIRTFYDYIYNLANWQDTASPPPHPDGGVRETFAGVLEQTMTALRYWDNLVQRSSVKLSAQCYGQSVVAAGFYRNISDREIGVLPNGVTLTLTFHFQKKDGAGVVTDWDGIAAEISDVKILDREGKCSAFEGLLGITIGPNTVVVQTISGSNMASGKEIYSDVALILLNTELFNSTAYSYQVDVTLEVTPTHLGPVSSANPVTKHTLVYFRPPDSTEEESSSA